MGTICTDNMAVVNMLTHLKGARVLGWDETQAHFLVRCTRELDKLVKIAMPKMDSTDSAVASSCQLRLPAACHVDAYQNKSEYFFFEFFFGVPVVYKLCRADQIRNKRLYLRDYLCSDV